MERVAVANKAIPRIHPMNKYMLNLCFLQRRRTSAMDQAGSGMAGVISGEVVDPA
jgi:hypothetical protein